MKRPKSGDVFEVEVPGGIGVVQFVARHSFYGEAILVGNARGASTHEKLENAYLTFYPISLAIREGVARLVGNLGALELPASYRRPGARVGRVVTTWVIDTPSGRTVKKSDALTAKDRALPVASIWSHDVLVHRIADGWRPEEFVY